MTKPTLKQNIIRYFRKGTNHYFPNRIEIKIGDIISLEETHGSDPKNNSIDMMGVVEELEGKFILNSGHRYCYLPEPDDVANIERFKFLGIRI